MEGEQGEGGSALETQRPRTLLWRGSAAPPRQPRARVQHGIGYGTPGGVQARAAVRAAEAALQRERGASREASERAEHAACGRT